MALVAKVSTQYEARVRTFDVVVVATNHRLGLMGGRGAGGSGGLGGVPGPENEKASHNMAEMWSTFARTGRPAAAGQPAWPAYTTDKRATMEIDTECKVVNDPYSVERQIWERLDP